MDPVKEDPGIEAWEDSSDSLDEESTPERRDEVQAIKNEARSETIKVLTWRFFTLAALIATAIAVTLTTYFLLAEQEEKSFETAVSVKLSNFASFRSFQKFNLTRTCILSVWSFLGNS